MAEEANRVWRSGRLFARIRAEKDWNRKRKRDTAHDGVVQERQGVTGMTTTEAKLLRFVLWVIFCVSD